MRRCLAYAAALMLLPDAALADDLYKSSNWSAMSADRKASQVGDLLTVVVYENAESSNTTKTDSKRSTQLGGGLSAGSINERGDLQFGGGYVGGGGVQRNDRVVAQISVTVRGVLPNGDLTVSGEQTMRLNGEATLIGIEGRVRREDILADNRVLSSRIADAKIIYDGKGFVSKSAKPGLVNRIFRFLGLG
ncbi:flagellar basal body L-ring protein FlgH [Sphingomonas sp. DT-204]|uniref:flagellar basal body L-ring protein FlgH n=1 Tax=Sphingomonas sp. DT-204 TaxID=3396166 RepID=UPI003F1B37E7